ncbi:cobalamin biosynthesis protein CobD [Oscillibacter valericigenes]|uniref:adenosylcobinamide-phosphate synthase CbiB n=1 Tax=Oscillibacter valericigenes TaxID=351091 RepID=UPI001F184EEE|nr:adenosylcobinamide-phosphate synthase CbiB [Oscillibacter valericigenes]MCF2663306.1 cobalamin biosynthesis protein CobD [Oscillibacter valericigenes]
MNHFLALLLGFCVDLVVGDPRCLPHPVQGMGWLIGKLEPPLRAVFPKTERGELHAGVCLVLLVVGLTGLATGLVLWAAGLVHPALRAVLEVVICWQILAAKSLRTETMKVVRALERGSLEDGRRAVSMVVGRDTDQLTEEEVLAADVETVAENAADGILAPLLWAALLGPVGGMCYKAVNTMDSMVGYQNDKYRYFGRAAALLDDVCNFLPARIAGLLMCLAAYLGFDGKNAFRIFFRDRKNHKSPNSAHTEAACAGALGLQLGGTHLYFGKPVEKPTIGDPVRPICREDVKRANDLALMTSVLALVLFDIIPLLLF